MARVHRAPLPDTASGVVGLKESYGSRHIVVPVSGTNAEIVLKRGNRQIQIRRTGRKGGINAVASAMRGCAGLGEKGKDRKMKFTACLQSSAAFNKKGYTPSSSLADGYKKKE